jgi:hypothetical protein
MEGKRKAFLGPLWDCLGHYIGKYCYLDPKGSLVEAESVV